MLGWSIGTTIGSFIDQSQQHFYTADMGRTSDLRVTVASYGTSIPQCFGLCRIPGILIWGTDLQEHENDINSGGGGSGGPKVTTRNYTYTVSFAIALCKGGRMASTSIKKIYADDLVVYDSTVSTTANRINPRFYIGSETQTADSLIIAQAGNTDIPAGTDNPAFRGLCYMVVQDMLLTDFGNRIPNFSILLDTGQLYISDVITDILSQVGINPSTQLDVSQVMTIPITGGLVASRIDAKSALQPFLTVYNVDLVDVNGKITAIPRGGSIVATIPFSDMGASTLGSGTVPSASRIVKTRVENVQLAKRIDVGYFSTSIDLQQAVQGAIRQSALNNNYVSLSFPLSLGDDEARKIAETQLYIQWVERLTYACSVLPKYSMLSAADPIFVQTDTSGTLQRVRVIEAETGMIGEIKLKLVRDESAILTQIVLGSKPTGGLPTLAPVTTYFFAWSGREIRSIDGTNPGFYVAATGASGWQGCTVYYSTDGGTTYNAIGGVTSRARFGTVSTILGNTYTPNTNGFDPTETLTFSLVQGSLTSTNESSVLNGLGNYGLLLKTDTSVSNTANYEMFGFANASLVSGTTYTISDLLRAQRSSLATGHTITDTFVSLDSAIARMTVSSSLVGHTILVKCVSPNQDISTVTPQTVYISAPNAPYASGASVSAVVPWYRSRWKINAIASGTTPGPSNFTSGYTAGTWYAHAPDGSVMWSDPGLSLGIQLRIGLKNNTASTVTVNFVIPFSDNGCQGIFNGTSFFSISTNGSVSAGTFIIPANTSGILELYYYNDSSGVYNTGTNPATFNYFMDALTNPALSWYDPGP